MAFAKDGFAAVFGLARTLMDEVSCWGLPVVPRDRAHSLRRQLLGEVHMPSRAVIWTLAVLAVVLVVVPLLGMLGMTACCGGMMGMGGNMMGGMSAVGIVWMLLAAAVVIALVVVLIRGVSRT